MSLSPLNERVDAPRKLELPIHPDVTRWRPLAPSDAPALAELHRTADAVDHPDWATPVEDIVEELGHSYLDLARDTIAGVTAEGRIVAYGLNIFPPEPLTIARVIVSGAVHPEVRGHGLGRQLLQWQRGRAQQQLAASRLPLPGWIMQYVDRGNVQGTRLGELLGFHAARYFSTLSRDLSRPVPETTLDPALQIVPWSAQLAAESLDVKNDGFRDHWGSQPTSAEQWDGMVHRPQFRTDLSFLVVQREAAAQPHAVGMVNVSVNEDDWALQGFSSAYVELLGTRRGWRGRGVGSSLLATVMRAASAQGLERLVLDVDTENPSGAVGLYTSLGFAANEGGSIALVLSY